ncbi:unnamed protein product [Haemonchus placei]|uniref:Cilia- and flagella-associated protein 36 n=1 Tax=Haemonchus placei TaxID=6290 RepID=A0A0N4X4Z0_HAEPC|nr:unnamed protein product [Haemonchus placei]
MLRKLSRKGSSPSTTSSLDPRTVRAKFLDFIDSTIWALPIATFIEQRSVVFDRQQGNVELYEQIHKEFIELVDTLVECFCADTNIPLKSLHDALKSTSLEPLAAAKDFNVFVPMMMRKNVELQLQALQMIEFMCGLLPSVLQIEDGETFKNKARVVSPEETERYVLIAVMRWAYSFLSTASNVASAPSVEATTSPEQKKPDSAGLSSDETPSKAVAGPERTSSKAAGESETATSTGTDSKPVRAATAKKDRRESMPAARTPSATEKERRPSVSEKPPTPKPSALLQEPNRLNSAAIRSRAEYLRMQRDRLLAMKTNEREKQLNVSDFPVKTRSRGGADDVIAARRAIVDQLKSEIDIPSTS